MRIELKFNDDVAILKLSGKFLAGSDGPFLRQKIQDLLDTGSKKLVVDMEEVPYIDSTGLGFLARSHQAAEAVGVRIVLSAVNQHVRKVLDGVHLTQFFTIVEDEAAAVAKLAGGDAVSETTKPEKAPKGKKRATENPQ